MLLLFYNLESESEYGQGLLDLKQSGVESTTVFNLGKSKLIAYCSEDRLLQLIQRAQHTDIDINNLPLLLTRPHPNSDLSIFSGWEQS